MSQDLRDRETPLVHRALLGVQPAFHVRFKVHDPAILDDRLHAAVRGAQMAESGNLGAGLRTGGGSACAPRSLVGMDERFHHRTEPGITGGRLFHCDDVFAIRIHGQHQAGVDEFPIH